MYQILWKYPKKRTAFIFLSKYWSFVKNSTHFFQKTNGSLRPEEVVQAALNVLKVKLQFIQQNIGI